MTWRRGEVWPVVIIDQATGDIEGVMTGIINNYWWRRAFVMTYEERNIKRNSGMWSTLAILNWRLSVDWQYSVIDVQPLSVAATGIIDTGMMAAYETVVR